MIFFFYLKIYKMGYTTYFNIGVDVCSLEINKEEILKDIRKVLPDFKERSELEIWNVMEGEEISYKGYHVVTTDYNAYICVFHSYEYSTDREMELDFEKIEKFCEFFKTKNPQVIFVTR